ncbi:reverse transcriptase domain-containing protein, partial [Bdellovibrionota bacterium FG-1]
QLSFQMLAEVGEAAGFDSNFGIPSGSPIVPPIENLFLLPLDINFHHLSPESFYARYGDDFLFASVSKESCEKASAQIEAITGELGLHVSKEKKADLLLCGTKKSQVEPFTAALGVDWLGMRVLRNAKIGIKPCRFTDLRQHLKRELDSLVTRAYRELRDRPAARKAMIRAGIGELLSGERATGLTALLHQQHNEQLLKEADCFVAEQLVRELARRGKTGRREAWKIYRELAVPSLLQLFRKAHYDSSNRTPEQTYERNIAEAA